MSLWPTTRSSSFRSPERPSTGWRTFAASSRAIPAWTRLPLKIWSYGDIVTGTEYGLTPTYTLVVIEGSGTRGTFLARVRYPDGSRWWAVNLYELRDGLLVRCRMFFAPELDPPDWRASFRTEH